MVRGLLAAALAAASPALADGSIDGMGRITAMGGYRWAPDPNFAQAAAAAGHPFAQPYAGGLEGAVSFGYGATDFVEAAIDVFGAYDRFVLEGYEPFASVSYGAFAGARLSQLDVLVRGLVPHLGLQAGLVLASVSTPTVAVPSGERALFGLSVNGGVTWRFAERFGVTLDVRFIYARVFVPDLAGLNVGGGLFSLGFTTYLPAAPKRDLPVPGF